MARLMEWDGEPFALLVSDEEGDYLVPPIVLDENERPMEGLEVLQAIAETGVTVEHPVLKRATPADLAEIDQRMARISEELDVPIGLPYGGRARA